MVFVLLIIVSLFTSSQLYCQKQEGTRSLNMVLLVDRGAEPGTGGPLVQLAAQAILQKAGVLVATREIVDIYLWQAMRIVTVQQQGELLEEKKKMDDLLERVGIAIDGFSKIMPHLEAIFESERDFASLYREVLAISEEVFALDEKFFAESKQQFLEKVKKRIEEFGGMERIDTLEKEGIDGMFLVKGMLRRMLGDLYELSFEKTSKNSRLIEEKINDLATEFDPEIAKNYAKKVAEYEKGVASIKEKFDRLTSQLRIDFSIKNGATGLVGQVEKYLYDFVHLGLPIRGDVFGGQLNERLGELKGLAQRESDILKGVVKGEVAAQEKFSIRQRVNEIVKELSAAQQRLMRDLAKELREDPIKDLRNNINLELKNMIDDEAGGRPYLIDRSLKSLQDYEIYHQQEGNYYVFVPNEYKNIVMNDLNLRDTPKQLVEGTNFNKVVYKDLRDLSSQVLRHEMYGGRKINEAQMLSKLFVTGKDNPNLGSWNMFIGGHGAGGPKYKEAYIAGMPLDNFKSLLTFFSQDIKTQFLYYLTCYGGGENLEEIKRHMDVLDRDFRKTVGEKVEAGPIIVSGGIGDIAVYTATSILKPAYVDFVEYFNTLRNFFQGTMPFKSDPIKEILQHIEVRHAADPGNITGIPQVWIPGAGMFRAVDVDNNVLVVTKVIEQARTLEKKPIEGKDKAAILIYPESVRVPLVLKGSLMTRIVSMIPGDVVHEFDSIEAVSHGNFTDFLSASLFMEYHASKTFVIKNLSIALNNLENVIVRNEKLPDSIFQRGRIDKITAESKYIPFGSWHYMYPETFLGKRGYVVGSYSDKTWRSNLLTKAEVEAIPELKTINDIRKKSIKKTENDHKFASRATEQLEQERKESERTQRELEAQYEAKEREVKKERLVVEEKPRPKEKVQALEVRMKPHGL